MTEAELKAMLTADFLTMDGLVSFVYTDTTGSGNSTQTVDNARITFPEAKSFGEIAVRGYQISGVSLTFPTGEISVTPKIGDYVAVDGNTYEVTKAEKKTAFTRWRIEAERAYIESDHAITITQQRATLSQDAMGAPVETWATVTTHSAVRMNEDDVADMLDRLGVSGDKQAITLFVAQTASFLPMDRVLIGGRAYRITLIGDEGRVARLLKIRVELYA